MEPIKTTLVIGLDPNNSTRIGVIYELSTPNQVAKLAVRLAEAALTGRGGGMIAKPSDYCDMAEGFYEEFQSRGWMNDFPDPALPSPPSGDPL